MQYPAPRWEAARSVRLGLAASLLLSAPSIALAQPTAAIVFEGEGADEASVSASVVGALAALGYELSDPGAVQAARAFTGDAGAPLDEASGEALRANLGLTRLIVIALRPNESGEVYVAVQVHSAGGVARRFARSAPDGVGTLAAQHVAELCRGAPPGQGAAPAGTPAAAASPEASPAATAPPPAAGAGDSPPASSDGPNVGWGDLGLVLGLTAGMWLFTPVMAGLGCDFDCVHVDYSFIPIFGAWIGLAAAPYPDATGLVIVGVVQDLLWGVSVLALILAIQTARRPRAPAAEVAELPLLVDAAPRPGGGVLRVGGRF